MDKDRMIAALSAVGSLNTFVDPHEVPDVICDQVLAVSGASNVTLSAVSFWSPPYLEYLRYFCFTPLDAAGQKEATLAPGSEADEHTGVLCAGGPRGELPPQARAVAVSEFPGDRQNRSDHRPHHHSRCGSRSAAGRG